jgi:aminoglycoside/choline kinase family phosphotransferase
MLIVFTPVCLNGQGGNDKIYGAGGMDSLRVSFDSSNLLVGGGNPGYLGSDGNYFSAHDRFVVNHDVETADDLYLGDYLLVGVDAILAQDEANGSVLLQDLGSSETLAIGSFVNLIDGSVGDTSQLLSVLGQVSEKAVALGIGEMTLGELDALMIKVQSVAEDASLTIEVDFVKDIDMVTVIGQLPDGNTFVPVQSFINPVSYELRDEDSFSNPYSNGIKGVYQGTDASDQVDLSDGSVGYGFFQMGSGDDTVLGTGNDDVFSLQGKGTYTIDGGAGNDVADINVTGMWDEGNPSVFGLHVEFDEETLTYTVYDNIDNQMEPMLTVSANEGGGWTAISTDLGKEKFNLADANLTNVESVRIFIGVDPNNNDEDVIQTLDLTVLDSIISTETYTLNLSSASSGFVRVTGTDGSDTLNLADIATEQNLAGNGVDVNSSYVAIEGGSGDDKLTGAGGMDSLRVSFDSSNLLVGGGNPGYLGSDGNYFSAHDRFVVNHDVETADDLYLGDYLLVGVDAILAQDEANGSVLLQDLGSSETLAIGSFVNLIDGSVGDTSQLLSVLGQVSEKAVALGIGEMTLGELDALMIKVQSVAEDASLTIEVDFVKDIDMVTVIGQLPDGNTFVPVQSFINPVSYELRDEDSFSNPYSNGIKGVYQGTDASDQVDLSDGSVGYGFFQMGSGDDTVVGTGNDDVFSLQGKGTYTIDGGAGNDVADINVTGMWDEGNPSVFGLHVEFDEETLTYTVYDNIDNQMEPMLTVSANEGGGWTAISTDLGKEKFNLADANLTNVESVRIFIGVDPNNNDEDVIQTLDLTVLDSIISTETYTLNLSSASSGFVRVTGTDGSDTLNLADIATEQNLAGNGVDVNSSYVAIEGGSGDDKLTGAGGMDSLRVSFDSSNLLVGGGNPGYLGSDGNYFSAHDRFVVNHDVETADDLYLGDYLLVGVDAILAQDEANGSVLLQDLGSSETLAIGSFVNLIDGSVGDTSQLLSVLGQVSEKAVALGIGEMTLGELDALMIKVQSVAEDASLTIEVDFVKDIDMVTVIGQLPDGNTFVPVQSFINPVSYELRDEDSFSNPYSNGIKGVYQGTDASDQVDLSDGSVGYGFFQMGSGEDTVVGTGNDDVFYLQGKGTYTIDGGAGNDVADINVTGMWDEGNPSVFGLHVEFDEQTLTYTVYDNIDDQMAPMLTVSANEGGGWTAISTDLGKEKFNLADANLTNVESVRIFIGVDPNNNDEDVIQTLDLIQLGTGNDDAGTGDGAGTEDPIDGGDPGTGDGAGTEDPIDGGDPGTGDGAGTEDPIDGGDPGTGDGAGTEDPIDGGDPGTGDGAGTEDPIDGVDPGTGDGAGTEDPIDGGDPGTGDGAGTEDPIDGGDPGTGDGAGTEDPIDGGDPGTGDGAGTEDPIDGVDPGTGDGAGTEDPIDGVDPGTGDGAGTEDPIDGGDPGTGDGAGTEDPIDGGDPGTSDGAGTEDPENGTSDYIEIIGTDQDDEIDLSNESDSHYVVLGQGDDVVIGTSSDDWFSLEGGGVDTINGGAGNDVAEVVLGIFEGRELKIESNEERTFYMVSEINTSDGSENEIFRIDIAIGTTWGLESTSYGVDAYGLGNATLTDIEEIVISYGEDSVFESMQQDIELVGNSGFYLISL